MVAVERLCSKAIDRLIIRFTVQVGAEAAQGITGVEAEAGVLQLLLLVLTPPEVAEVLELLLEEAVVAEEAQAKLEAVAQAAVMAVLVVQEVRPVSTTFTTYLLAAAVAVQRSLATPTLHG